MRAVRYPRYMSSTSLYVFIDESGHHATGKHYSVAAAWCLSDRARTMRVLEATRDRMADHIGATGELKGASTPPSKLDSVIPSMTDYGFRDSSVVHKRVPWATEEPIRHTIHDANPAVAKQVIGDITGQPLDAPELLQTLALSRVLNPLFYPDRLDASVFDEAIIILDSETWQHPATRLAESIDTVGADVPDELTFETRDSQSTPGIQIADLAAYSWLRHRKVGDCKAAVRAIKNRQLADY